MNEARILQIFSVVIGVPALWYIAVRAGFSFAFCVFLAMWAQNCWLTARIVRNLEDRYERKEAARTVMKTSKEAQFDETPSN